VSALAERSCGCMKWNMRAFYDQDLNRHGGEACWPLENSSQIPLRASTTRGFSLSFCLGPLAQMATSRPPGFNIFKRA
jgi:hypothetical protein